MKKQEAQGAGAKEREEREREKRGLDSTKTVKATFIFALYSLSHWLCQRQRIDKRRVNTLSIIESSDIQVIFSQVRG